MIDYQVNWNQRIDFLGITTETIHSGSHCGQVNNSRYTRKILQYDSRWMKRNFFGRRRRCLPSCQVAYVVFAYFVAVAMA